MLVFQTEAFSDDTEGREGGSHGWNTRSQPSIMDRGSPWQTFLGLQRRPRSLHRETHPADIHIHNYHRKTPRSAAGEHRECGAGPTRFNHPCRTRWQGDGKSIQQNDARLTCTARVKKTPASEASFLTLKSMVLVWAYRQGVFVPPCRGDPPDQLRWGSSRRSAEALIRLMDDRKSALRPAFKETRARRGESRPPRRQPAACADPPPSTWKKQNNKLLHSWSAFSMQVQIVWINESECEMPDMCLMKCCQCLSLSLKNS